MIGAGLTTYLDEARKPYPFCPGCGHAIIIDQLNAALVKLQLDPHQVVVVLDIGCVSLCREFFATNWFLGLHGRSVTYATGIKLANPDLKVIVLTGDGGLGIGGNHVLNAARRNVGITVLVFNNLNFGMTGGQHSITTPIGSVTSTTEYGHLERPLDICSVVATGGASFVARSTTFDGNLPDLIVQAIQNDGFSLVDVWELCTSYYAPGNRFGRKQLEGTLDALNYRTGVIHHEPRPEFGRAYRRAVEDQLGRAIRPPHWLPSCFQSSLDEWCHLVISGAAGKKINTAASLFGRGAVLSGLWASQRSDYPVTVKSGYSTSEVILSAEEVLCSGVPRLDILVVLFPEGLNRARLYLDGLSSESTLYLDANLPPVETAGRQVRLDFGKTGPWARKKEYWAIMALAAVLRRSQLYPLEALEEAIRDQSSYAEESLAAVAASERLVDVEIAG